VSWSRALRGPLPDCLGQFVHLSHEQLGGIDLARGRLAVRSFESGLESGGLGANLNKYDVVLLGLGERGGALRLAADEMAAGCLMESGAQLHERNEQSLTVTF
jgi:hypothetical protein